jgi:hypothetical protein
MDRKFYVARVIRGNKGLYKATVIMMGRFFFVASNIGMDKELL